MEALMGAQEVWIPISCYAPCPEPPDSGENRAPIFQTLPGKVDKIATWMDGWMDGCINRQTRELNLTPNPPSTLLFKSKPC